MGNFFITVASAALDTCNVHVSLAGGLRQLCGSFLHDNFDAITE
jgi:hypothetical protein